MKRFRIVPVPIAAVALALLLAGCAEESPGPQFASDPLPTRAPTEEIVASPSPPPVAEATPVAIATPASIGELIRSRGAPDRLYIASDDAVWAVTSSGDSREVFEAEADERILAIDPSPDASQIAILLGSLAETSPGDSLLILDDDGEVVTEYLDLAGGDASPAAGVGAGADVVDWSPQGNRLLIAFRNGPISVVNLDEESPPTALDIKTSGASILRPAWSPTGEAIAFIAGGDNDRERVLYVYSIADESLVDVVRPGEGRFVVDFTWMPDGVSLLFTEAGELAGAVSGIDLWQIDATGENRALVASAGSVAPVARITNARPSPDGRSIAYAVQVPGPGQPLVDSVWVRDLASGVGFRLALPSVASVEDISWTDQGLVISAITSSSSGSQPQVLALLQVKPEGMATILWVAPVAAATPVSGTPVAPQTPA